MGWSLDAISVLITLQVVGASAVFLLLNTYNPKHRRRVLEAHEALGRKDASIFELPAFRATGFECQNPFENSTWLLTWYEKGKLSLLAVTVFPIRVLGVLLTVLSTYAVASLFLKLSLQPMARTAVAMGCRMLLFCFGFYRIEVRGRQAPGVGVLVSNHCTFLDGVVWMAVSTPRVFAEESNFRHPVMRVFARALDVVCFDRSGQESRRMAREMMASSAAEAFAGHAPPILVFPEGTTKNLKTIITFKDGAFATGLPVQPAVLRYRFQHCDPTWVFAGPGLLMLVFRLLCQVVNWLEVEYLPVCSPSEEEKCEPHKFARRVQLQVASAMKVPVTEHAVEDLQFELAAVKAKLPAEVGVVGFSALKEVFSVDAQKIKQQMLVFKEMDRDGKGRVSFDEFKDCFQRAFHTPSQAQTELLYKFFHQLTGGQPTLDFRKFLIGLALVNETKGLSPQDPGMGSCAATSPPQLEEFVDKYRGRMYTHLAFAAFAASSDGYITWKEFEALWSWLHPADSSARHVFEEIGESGVEELTFDMFTSYSEKKPEFEKQLRQAFFSRISSDLSP